MTPQTSPAALFALFLTVALTVAGQLLVKKGMLDVGASPSEWSLLPRFLFRAFTNIYVTGGLLCALLAAACWTVAISRAALNFAYPFMGLVIVLVLVFSGVCFGESVPLNRWLGAALVVLGLVIAAGGK